MAAEIERLQAHLAAVGLSDGIPDAATHGDWTTVPQAPGLDLPVDDPESTPGRDAKAQDIADRVRARWQAAGLYQPATDAEMEE
jgi:hypothetical protein